MQETKSTNHPLLRWILVQYLRILLIPTILYTSLNINKLVDIVHEITSNILDPSLTAQTQEQTTNQPQSFIHVYDIIKKRRNKLCQFMQTLNSP